jgi:glycosyltransferase involved in cell wall biosynthesis
VSKALIKVAVFNTNPPHLCFGGVERRIIEIAKNLQKEAFFNIYCSIKGGFKKPQIINGAKIIPCFSTNLFFPIDNCFFNRSIFKMSNVIKADIYEAHTVSGYGFLKALNRSKCKKPFIQTIHGVLLDEYIKSFKTSYPTPRTKLSRIFMYKLANIEKILAENATLIVTVSKYSFSKIVQLYNVDAAKIRIIPNGVDVQIFKPNINSKLLRREFGLNDKPCVLFVGNLIPRKGVHFLLEAAKHVLRENNKVKFLIVGEGPLKKHLIGQSKKSNIYKNFLFLGNVPDHLLSLLYNCADVFTLTSIQEGQGISLLEAQASATPVVAFDIGGVNEIVVNKKTGLLVKPDGYELADAILKLLSDEVLREKMGNYAREFICKNFSWSRCAESMLKVYREAIEIGC